MSRSHTKTQLIHAFALTAALSLAACGGDGGDDTPAPTPAPPAPTPAPPAPAPSANSVTLSGQVARNGTLKNVVVCLDLNGNDACDSGEPASAPTGADGNYTLTYDAAVVTGAASARLIAPVKTGDPAAATTAIDSYNPAVAATTADYAQAPGRCRRRHQPADHPGAGRRGRRHERGRCTRQRGRATGHRPRQDRQLPGRPGLGRRPGARHRPRTAAALISGMLRGGVPLEVGDQNAAVAADSLLNGNLYFQDAGNFFVQTLDTQAKAAGTSGSTVLDTRSGKTGGVTRTVGGDSNSLYRSAYLSPTGWTWCGPNEPPIQVTVGVPSRSLTCGTRVQRWSRPIDIAGQGMAASSPRARPPST